MCVVCCLLSVASCSLFVVCLCCLQLCDALAHLCLRLLYFVVCCLLVAYAGCLFVVCCLMVLAVCCDVYCLLFE